MKQKNYQLLYLSLFLFFLHISMQAQSQQVIEGSPSSTDPVVKVEVGYEGQEQIIGIEATSFPATSQLYGIGGSFSGGWKGVEGTSHAGYGLYAKSFMGHGSMFQGADGKAAILLEGSTYFGGSDDGVIMTNPSKSGSDLALVANDDVVIQIDKNEDSDEGVFRIQKGISNNNTGTDVFTVDEDGSVTANEITVPKLLGSVDIEGSVDIGGGVDIEGSAVIKGESLSVGFDAFPDMDGYISSSGGAIHIQQKPILISENNIEEIGLKLTRYDGPINYWNIYTLDNDDLGFAYQALLRAYIEDGSGSFVITSDARLKKDIEPFSSILSQVMKLKPSTYYYKSDDTPERKSWGFLAQEVEAVFPEIVVEKNGLKTLVYDDFAILGIKAIQEQQDLITNLESEVAELKSQLSQVMSLLKNNGE